MSSPESGANGVYSDGTVMKGRCPFCARYCSAEEGYCAPYPPDLSLDDGAECVAYCTQGHYETLLGLFSLCVRLDDNGEVI